MKNYIIILTIVIIFNYLLPSCLANDYYAIHIRKDIKDEEYDKANEKVQNEIDELVNDRMNDIYDIISENKESYVIKGKSDEKLNELNKASQLRKRDGTGKSKFKFINKNRPQKHTKRSNSEELNYIPFESNLVVHICPVLNYYVVIAYLSDEIVGKISALPNVIKCSKSKRLSYFDVQDDTTASNATDNSNETDSTKYYNEEEILKDTKWSGLSVQERKFDYDLVNTHLSLLSQGRYDYENSNRQYDNNYYYPSSAGKGIDVFVIDNGLNTSYNEEDFDTYEGTDDKRTVQCDGVFYDGQYHEPKDIKRCNKVDSFTKEINHGTLVSISALGTVNGVAKKANLHMLAIDADTYDVLTALDYVKQHGEPHKSVVNISSGCFKGEKICKDQAIEDKIKELVDYGVIIVAAAGNTSDNVCDYDVFSSSYGVIVVGAVYNEAIGYKLEKLYDAAFYSCHGECIHVFAPGTVRVFNNAQNKVLFTLRGTSFASPIVAGLVATLMAAEPEVQYTYELMKQKLIDLSLKDVLNEVPEDTPNRLVNNGKHSVYGPPGCNDPSKNYQCKDNNCCSKYGICIDSTSTDEDYKSLCYLENGCLSEFGFCDTNKCGENHNNRSCKEGQCCTETGDCVNIPEDSNYQCFVENGCLTNYSNQCLSGDIDKINNYDEKYHENIYGFNCEKELEFYENSCSFTSYFDEESYEVDKHTEICNTYINAHCKEFAKSPYEYIPSCEKAGSFNNFYSNKLKTSLQNLFCAKKDPSSSSDFCLETIMTFNEIIYNVHDTKKFCLYPECRETLYDYIKSKYDNIMKNKRIYEDEGEWDDYEKSIIELENIIGILTTTECIEGKEVEEIETTVTTTIDEKTSTINEKTTTMNEKPSSADDKTSTKKNNEDEKKTTAAPTTTTYATTTTTKTSEKPTGTIDNSKDDGDSANSSSKLQIYPKLINYLLFSLIVLMLF